MTHLPTIGRRVVLGGLATALAAPAIIGRARADDTVKMASILDLSGGLAIYGKSIHMCMQLATEDINASGGLNGKKLEMLSYDTQSNMQLYSNGRSTNGARRSSSSARTTMHLVSSACGPSTSPRNTAPP
jgi:hypothetical protein